MNMTGAEQAGKKQPEKEPGVVQLYKDAARLKSALEKIGRVEEK